MSNIGPRETAFYQSIAPEYNPEWKPLHSDKAFDLFKEHACMFGESNGVHIAEACRLFGWRPVVIVEEEAASEVLRKAGIVVVNHHGGVSDGASYLTLKGFLRAVSLCNMRTFAKDQAAFWAARSADLDEIDARDAAAEAKPKRGRKPRGHQPQSDP